METARDNGAARVGVEREPIEVERKFSLDENTEARLRDLGATLVREHSFTDSYYDTSDYTLTMADHWLRRRDGQWQLKCPPPAWRGGNDATSPNDLSRSKDTHSSPSTASQRSATVGTQYAELETEEKIVRALLPVLVGGEASDVSPTHPAVPTGCSNLQDLLEKASLNEFAQYTTQRKTYALDGFTIDLDLTDFGFQVGEIEVVVADESRTTEALRRIDELAAKLGRYQSQS